MKLNTLLLTLLISASLIGTSQALTFTNSNSSSNKLNSQTKVAKQNLKFETGKNSHNNSYGYKITDKFSRVGDTSERFEVRHGDCSSDDGYGWSDCNNDRQRFNRKVKIPYRDSDFWYSWSFYLPNNFMIQPAGTAMGDISLMYGGGNLFQIVNKTNDWIQLRSNVTGENCNLIKVNDAVGSWTDIMMRANYSPSSENPIDIWINGKNAGCLFSKPLTTEKLLKRTTRYKSGLNNLVSFSYGIYQSFVSRWLDEHKTKETSGDISDDTSGEWLTPSGDSYKSPDRTPFNEDWGVKLPTAVMYYDAVRIGKSRDEVNIFYDDAVLDLPPVSINMDKPPSLNYGNFGNITRVQNYTPHGYTLSTDITGEAPTKYIEILEVRNGDCYDNQNDDGWNDCKYDTERIDLMQDPRGNSQGDEYWYGWSVYFPEDFVDIHPSFTKINEFVKDKIEWLFYVNESGYKLNTYLPNEKISHKNIIGKRKLLGKWHTIVVHVKWSDNSSGFFKVWRMEGPENKRLRVDYKGPTMLTGSNHFRYGISRDHISEYKEENSTDIVPTQKVYFSNVKRADTREGLLP